MKRAEPKLQSVLTSSCQKRAATEGPKAPAPATKKAKSAEAEHGAGAEEAPRPFFEQQVAEQCGIHALNNALGFHCFGVEDMLHAAETFLFENPELGDRQQDHVAPEGDYSIEIMLMALRAKAMQDFGRLRWRMEDRQPRSSKTWKAASGQCKTSTAATGWLCGGGGTGSSTWTPCSAK